MLEEKRREYFGAQKKSEVPLVLKTLRYSLLFLKYTFIVGILFAITSGVNRTSADTSSETAINLTKNYKYTLSSDTASATTYKLNPYYLLNYGNSLYYNVDKTQMDSLCMHKIHKVFKSFNDHNENKTMTVIMLETLINNKFIPVSKSREIFEVELICFYKIDEENASSAAFITKKINPIKVLGKIFTEFYYTYETKPIHFIQVTYKTILGSHLLFADKMEEICRREREAIGIKIEKGVEDMCDFFTYKKSYIKLAFNIDIETNSSPEEDKKTENSFAISSNACSDDPAQESLFQDKLNSLGISNEQNQCYLNSLFQVLYAYEPLKETIIAGAIHLCLSRPDGYSLYLLAFTFLSLEQIRDLEKNEHLKNIFKKSLQTLLEKTILSYNFKLNTHQDPSELLFLILQAANEYHQSLSQQKKDARKEEDTSAIIKFFKIEYLIRKIKLEIDPVTRKIISIFEKEAIVLKRDFEFMQILSVENNTDSEISINNIYNNAAIEIKSSEKEGTFLLEKKIVKAPPLFTFNLNRSGSYGKKDSTSVILPETLFLCYGSGKFVEKMYKDKNKAFENYRLFAVINHLGGSVKAGHYIAYIRCRDYWLLFDDDKVTKVLDIEDIDKYDQKKFQAMTKSNCFLIFYLKEKCFLDNPVDYFSV